MLSSAHFNAAREASDEHAMSLSLSLANNDVIILKLCVGYFTALHNNNILEANTCVRKLDEYYKSQEAK